MESPMNSIGFSHIQSEEQTEKLIKKILNKPTKQNATEIDEHRVIAEYIVEYAERTYMMVRGVIDRREEQPKIVVQQVEPYMLASKNMKVKDIEIEDIDEEQAYYVICEHKETAMQIIFWLQNAVEYIEGMASDKTCQEINISGLALEGTIILPVEKDEEEIAAQKEEREKLKNILNDMKNGSIEAKMQLEEEEREIDKQLKERMRQEDFLSIMSGYFIPTTLEDGIYAVLGEIITINERINTETRERMYILELDVNEMILEVAVNQDELVGSPSVGMRFLGTCWIQGKIIMS